ncbi:uncharacterized protein RNJ42_01532 [Nakaseomyces bracarensis]|uniref:uncharacterized protein n=1 Tax=Nakaseomyces bracarensis TaxID=273131 RepID=UPI003872776F
MQQNTLRKTKRHFCSFCNKAFSRSEHKTRHERSHAGVKPFECQVCSHSFVRRDLLQRHIRTVHRILLLRDSAAATTTTSTDRDAETVNNIEKLINSMIIVNTAVTTSTLPSAIENKNKNCNNTKTNNNEDDLIEDMSLNNIQVSSQVHDKSTNDTADKNSLSVSHHTNVDDDDGKVNFRNNSNSNNNDTLHINNSGGRRKNKSKYIRFKLRTDEYGEYGNSEGMIAIDYSREPVLSSFEDDLISLIKNGINDYFNIELLLLVVYLMDGDFPHTETCRRIFDRVVSNADKLLIESQLIVALQLRYDFLPNSSPHLLSFYRDYQSQLYESAQFSVFNLNQWTCLSNFLNFYTDQQSLSIFEEFKKKFLLDKKSILLSFEILNMLNSESKRKFRNLNSLDYLTNLTYWEMVLLNDHNINLLMELNKNYCWFFENGYGHGSLASHIYGSDNKQDTRQKHIFKVLSNSHWILLELIWWNKGIEGIDTVHNIKSGIITATIPLMNSLIENRERLSSIKNDGSKLKVIVDSIFFQLELFSVHLLPVTGNSLDNVFTLLSDKAVQDLIYNWYLIVTKTFSKFKTNDKRLKLIKQFINSYIKKGQSSSSNKKLKLNDESSIHIKKEELTTERLKNDLSTILYDMWSNEYQGYHFLIDTLVKCIKDDFIEGRLLQIINQEHEEVKLKLIDAVLGAISRVEGAIKNSESQYLSTLNRRRSSASQSVSLPIKHESVEGQGRVNNLGDANFVGNFIFPKSEKHQNSKTPLKTPFSSESSPKVEDNWSAQNSFSHGYSTPNSRHNSRVRNSISNGMISHKSSRTDSKIVLPPINLSAILVPGQSGERPSTSSYFDRRQHSYTYGSVLLSPQSGGPQNGSTVFAGNESISYGTNSVRNSIHDIMNTRHSTGNDGNNNTRSSNNSSNESIHNTFSPPNNFTYGLLSGYSIGSPTRSIQSKFSSQRTVPPMKTSSNALDPIDGESRQLQETPKIMEFKPEQQDEKNEKSSMKDSSEENYQDQRIRLPPPSELLNSPTNS